MDDTRIGSVDGTRTRQSPTVAVNALSYRVRGSGVQTYGRELIESLPDAWPDAQFCAFVAPDAPPFTDRVERREVKGLLSSGLIRKVRSARQRADADVIHGLDTDQPICNGCATVATVHDLALFDVPWAFSLVGGAAKRAFVSRSIRSADALISVSAFTAERVLARFGRESTVIHEAAAPLFQPANDAEIIEISTRYGLPDRFVLYVGNHEPRKDLVSLGAACEQAGVTLIVAGGAIAASELPAHARAIGYVADADLPALYGCADVVAYVARYEGFGLPPVEAMASGGCVMATRVGALPDIAREGIEFVASGDVASQAEAVRRLINDAALAQHRRSQALIEAQQLSWARVAAETVGVYQQLV